MEIIMKRLIAAAALALLTAGQAHAQVFNRDASPEQVGRCLAHINIALWFSGEDRKEQSVTDALIYWADIQPDTKESFNNTVASMASEYATFLRTAISQDNGFLGLEHLRAGWATYAFESEYCKFAMGMTPAEAWSDLRPLLAAIQLIAAVEAANREREAVLKQQ
jgi:hypothetical protein